MEKVFTTAYMSFTCLATLELFSGHVELNVSLQLCVDRLILVGDFL